MGRRGSARIVAPAMAASSPPNPNAQPPNSPTHERAVRALPYVGTAALVVAAALLLWYGLTYFLLLFLGILLALLLRAPANWLVARTPLPDWAALALVGIGILGLLALGGYFFGNAMASQTLELGERLPQIVASIVERARENEWVERVLRMFSGGDKPSGEKVVGGAVKAAGATIGVIAHVAIVLFFAVFLAAQPRIYVEGVLRLIPLRRRQRACDVLESIGEVLQRWLVGQAVLMASIAILTFAGLTFLGVPLALPLALLAGLLNFIPYVGPILSSVPAILVGISEGPQMAAYVALLFAGVQSVEGYILEPLVQHRAVYLPPALILFAQLLLGLLAGPIGVIVATPFAAAFVVAVRMLYVEDALGDRAA
jgi:predicted PurR-regulated permease PerM